MSNEVWAEFVKWASVLDALTDWAQSQDLGSPTESDLSELIEALLVYEAGADSDCDAAGLPTGTLSRFILQFIAARGIHAIAGGGPQVFGRFVQLCESDLVGVSLRAEAERNPGQPLRRRDRREAADFARSVFTSHAEGVTAAWNRDALPDCAPDDVDVSANSLEARLARIAEYWVKQYRQERLSSDAAKQSALMLAMAYVSGLQLFVEAENRLVEIYKEVTVRGPRVAERPGGAAPVENQRLSGPTRAQAPERGSAIDIAIKRLVDALPIDEHHVRQDDELGWFAYRHPHSFQFMATEDGVRILSRVSVVRKISDATLPPGVVADMFNKHASMSALVHGSKSGTLDLITTGYFSEESLQSTSFDLFVFGAVLSNWEANARAEGLAAMVGGRPAWAVHPELGPRDAPHPALLTMEDVPVRGADPNRFSAEALGALATSGLVPWQHSRTIPGGVTGEFEVGDRQARTTVLGMEHPTYGAGAFVLTQVPFRGDVELTQVASLCNLAEAVEDTGHAMVGAWTPDPDGDPVLAHVTFVPNAAASIAPFPYLAAMDYLRMEWFSERFL